MESKAVQDPGCEPSLKRIAFLDGFRGVAILLVLGYHYFSRFANEAIQYYPYGDFLASIPIFELGYNGVYLFFVVSGFVIAMTLSRTANLTEFAVRRFARLWPTMLLCSTITYLVLSYWPIFWPQSPINFLSSLTFIDGSMVWGQLSPALQSQWIDGAYWTLFVEVRFYFIASLLYFVHPSRFSRNMGLLMLGVTAFYCGAISIEKARLATIIDILLIAPYFPWFLGGLAAYEIWQGQHRKGLLLAIGSFGAVALLALVNAPGANLWVAVVIAGLFLLCICSETVSYFFSARWLSIMGISSYSLYLVHQRVGVTLTAVAAEEFGMQGPASTIILLVVAIGLVGTAYIIWRFWEQPINRKIVGLYVRTSEKMRLKSEKI